MDSKEPSSKLKRLSLWQDHLLGSLVALALVVVPLLNHSLDLSPATYPHWMTLALIRISLSLPVFLLGLVPGLRPSTWRTSEHPS